MARAIGMGMKTTNALMPARKTTHARPLAGLILAALTLLGVWTVWNTQVVPRLESIIQTQVAAESVHAAGHTAFRWPEGYRRP